MTTQNHSHIRRLAARIDLNLPRAASGYLATKRGVVRIDAVPHLLAVDAKAWAQWSARLLRREAAYADAMGDDGLADSLLHHAQDVEDGLRPETACRTQPAVAQGLALRQLAPVDGTRPWHLPSLASHAAETPPEFPRRALASFLLVADEDMAALAVARPLRPLGLFAPPWLRFRAASPEGLERAASVIGRDGLHAWIAEGGEL